MCRDLYRQSVGNPQHLRLGDGEDQRERGLPQDQPDTRRENLILRVLCCEVITRLLSSYLGNRVRSVMKR